MNTKKNIGITVLVAAVLTLAGLFLYREMGPGYGYGYGRHMMVAFGGWGMGTMMLVFWGLILFGLIWLINWALDNTKGAQPSGAQACDAREILKRRFARGEIDAVQYRQMRDELSR